MGIPPRGCRERSIYHYGTDGTRSCRTCSRISRNSVWQRLLEAEFLRTGPLRSLIHRCCKSDPGADSSYVPCASFLTNRTSSSTPTLDDVTDRVLTAASRKRSSSEPRSEAVSRVAFSAAFPLAVTATVFSLSSSAHPWYSLYGTFKTVPSPLRHFTQDIARFQRRNLAHGR